MKISRNQDKSAPLGAHCAIEEEQQREPAVKGFGAEDHQVGLDA